MTVTESDALTTAAKAIGTTLGKIAVRTGIAKPQEAAPQVRQKVAAVKKTAKKVAKKTTKKTPAARAAAGTKRKAPSKRSPAPAPKKRK